MRAVGCIRVKYYLITWWSIVFGIIVRFSDFRLEGWANIWGVVLFASAGARWQNPEKCLLDLYCLYTSLHYLHGTINATNYVSGVVQKIFGGWIPENLSMFYIFIVDVINFTSFDQILWLVYTRHWVKHPIQIPLVVVYTESTLLPWHGTLQSWVLSHDLKISYSHSLNEHLAQVILKF